LNVVQAEPPLNLAQQQVVDLLGASGAERPIFDADLAPSLRRELERGLAPVVAALPEDANLFVNKHALSQVHGCEARYLAELDGDFAWSVPIARGTLAHRAIEVGVSWSGPPTPADLVVETMARAANGTDSLGDWLRTCGDFDRADLQSQATERVSTFFECFPPLKRQWRPTLEGRVRAELFDGRIVASGKYDLSLGTASGNTAGKVIIDFKTGGFSPTHLDDLRFYALLDTLKIGTPPRLVASYYLDAGRAHPELVGVAQLEAAVARTVDGIARIAELDEVAHRRVEPAAAGVVKRTGPACRWCPALASCAEGTAHLRDDRDAEADGSDWG
jgi:PD-(D/E)XK nuclease superfamily